MRQIVLPNRRLRLAFFGTPDFARAVLEGLLDAQNDDVVVVFCQPDRPKGRGKKLAEPEVKVLAKDRGIEVIQPKKMKDGAVATALVERKIDLSIVCAFGRILPKAILEATPHGAWNVHASLLPSHRGASPINHAILAGDRETGVTLMEMTEGLDEGPMLLKCALAIAADDTTRTLGERLSRLGADALVEGLSLAKGEGLTATPQDDTAATYAPLLEKAQGALDFQRPAEELERRVRAFDPWPGTFVPREDGPLKVLSAKATPFEGDQAPGTVVRAGPELVVRCGEGALALSVVQPPGKKAMPASDFLRGAGRGLTLGTSLS